MRRVVQKDRHGCGIACVAMIAGVSYPTARRAIFGDQVGTYTDANDLRRGLARFDIAVGRRIMEITTHGLADLDHDAILKVNLRRDGVWHWAVWDAKRNRILDPGQPPYKRHNVSGYLTIRRPHTESIDG